MGALIGGGVATLLSLCLLSRILADNPFYRLALGILIGTALGYTAAVLLRATLFPALGAMIDGNATTEQWTVTIAGALLALLLLSRFGRQPGSAWANIPLAYLFGIGGALALLGAVRGTLVPQLLDTVRRQDLRGDLAAQIGAAVLAALTIVTLLGFSYTTSTRRPEGGVFKRGIRQLARGLILLTFGIFLAAAVQTYVAALVGQVSTIRNWVALLLGR